MTRIARIAAGLLALAYAVTILVVVDIDNSATLLVTLLSTSLVVGLAAAGTVRRRRVGQDPS